MLFLYFQLGSDRYALDCSEVVEVVPMLAIKRIPQAPAAVAGALNYHGKPVPVIDLSQLALGRPAPRLMSTRIVIVNYPDGNGTQHLLGLIAEKATKTVRHEASDFIESGVDSDHAPYLGPVTADADGLLQWIDVKKMLPDAVRDVLFKQALEPA